MAAKNRPRRKNRLSKKTYNGNKRWEENAKKRQARHVKLMAKFRVRREKLLAVFAEAPTKLNKFQKRVVQKYNKRVKAKETVKK